MQCSQAAPQVYLTPCTAYIIQTRKEISRENEEKMLNDRQQRFWTPLLTGFCAPKSPCSYGWALAKEVMHHPLFSPISLIFFFFEHLLSFWVTCEKRNPLSSSLKDTQESCRLLILIWGKTIRCTGRDKTGLEKIYWKRIKLTLSFPGQRMVWGR